MQLIQDSVQPVKDSVHPDTVIWHRVFVVDSFHKNAGSDTVHSKDLFTDIYKGHELMPKHHAAEPLKHDKGDWLFFLVLLVASVLAYLRIAYRKYLDRLIDALFNINITNQIVRDDNLLVQRASLLLNFVFYVVAALLVYFLSLQYDWHINVLNKEFPRFLFIAMLIAAVYFLKFIVLKTAGWVFNLQREMTTYIFNIFLINNLLGIALFPIITLFIFFGYMQLHWLLMVAIILVGCAYVYRLIRGILIGLGASSLSPAYLFLYICALEITPLFVLIKLIFQQ